MDKTDKEIIKMALHLNSTTELDGLTEDKEMIIKASIMLDEQLNRIHQLEHLVALIKIAVNDKSINAIEAIMSIRKILVHVVLDQPVCNGDCNNCDQEH